MKILFTSIFLFIATSVKLFSQVDNSSVLFKFLKTNDSLLFNIGFNNCDIGQFENLLSDNFEFYHDKSGITSSKTAFIIEIRDGLCKLTYKPKRQLIENSLQVYPLEKNGVLYGAIQSGQHQFYASEKGKSEYLTSTAQFTHVWLLEKGLWKLSRGLSYNHIESIPNDSINESLLFKDRTETEKWLAQKHIPALGIAYIKNGKIQETIVFGKNEKGQAYPVNTLFNVASLTKPVTAMVTLKLVQAGKWKLDEPIYHYWVDPDIEKDPRNKTITTRHILSHQTGFPNWRRNQLLAFEFDPGTKYQYSGEGYE
jgi:hypothetical protein